MAPASSLFSRPLFHCFNSNVCVPDPFPFCIPSPRPWSGSSASECFQGLVKNAESQTLLRAMESNYKSDSSAGRNFPLEKGCHSTISLTPVACNCVKKEGAVQRPQLRGSRAQYADLQLHYTPAWTHTSATAAARNRIMGLGAPKALYRHQRVT